MVIRKIFLLCAILFAAISADAQLVKLSRLERAGGKDYIPFTDANGKQSYQLLQNILDTMVQVGGGGGDVFGNGAYGLDAMWVNDSTIWRGHVYWDSIGRSLEFYPNDTYDNWMVSMDSTNKTIYFDPDHDATSEFQISTNTAGFFEFTGSPVLSNSSGLYWYTFNGDTNTGIRRQSGDVLNFQAGDASNPMVQLDGPGDFVNIDANDDATKEVIFGATTADFISEVRINTPSTDNTTHLAGLDAGEDVTKVALDSSLTITTGASVDTLSVNGWFLPTMANVHYNGQVQLTASSDTLVNFPQTMYSSLDFGDVTVDDNNGTIVAGFDGVALITFHCELDNQGSSYSSYVAIYVYKNNAYVSTLTNDVELMQANERKALSFQSLINVSDGDEFIVKYEQGSVASIYVTLPNLTFTRVR